MTEDTQARRFYWVLMALAVLTVVGLALRVAYCVTHPIISTDGVKYCSTAMRIYGEDPFCTKPVLTLYPYLVGLIWLITGAIQTSARIVSLAAGTALIPLTYVLGRHVASRRSALTAAALVALLPACIAYSATELVDALYSLLYLANALLLLIFFKKPSLRSAALFGLLAGLTILTRAESICFLLVALVLMAILRFPNNQANWLLRGKWMGVTLAVVAALYGVYLGAVALETGQWGWTGRSYPSVGQCNPVTRFDYSSREAETSDGESDADGSGVVGGVKQIAKTYRMNIAEVLKDQLPRLVPFYLLALVPIGIFGVRSKSPPFRERLLVLAAAAWPFAAIPLVHFFARYFLGYVSLLAVFAATGLGVVHAFAMAATQEIAVPQVRDWFQQQHASTAIYVCIVLMAFAPLLVLGCQDLRKPESELRVQSAAAGRWISANVADADAVMARKTQAAFYAGARFVWLPRCEPAELTAAAKKGGADIVVLGRAVVNERRPSLVPLLDQGEPEGLELLHREHNFAVFRVVPGMKTGIQ